MSVLRSKRKTAFTEFEHHMSVLCREMKARLNPVPKRYKKFICPKIYNPCSNAYKALILANEQNARTPDGLRRRITLFESALRDIQGIQKPLIAAWNILDTKDESAERWADMVNKEIALITGAMRDGRRVSGLIVTLPRKAKIAQLAFLNTMCELHKYTYSKIGRAPNEYFEFISEPIADFINAALANVVVGNSILPTTHDEAVKRERYFQGAIDNLNAMQRPMLALWNLTDYSERVMNEWSGLLDTEIRLLEGLKKADRERYRKLK